MGETTFSMYTAKPLKHINHRSYISISEQRDNLLELELSLNQKKETVYKLSRCSEIDM
jgi:hypothetical protein